MKTKIRQKLIELIKDKTDAGDKVYDTRLPSFNSENYPCVTIYNLSEDVTTFDKGYGSKRYDLSLAIEVFAAGVTEKSAGELLDSISDEIESIIENSSKLDGLVNDIGIDGGELATFSEGELPLISWKIKVDCCYIKNKGVSNGS